MYTSIVLRQIWEILFGFLSGHKNVEVHGNISAILKIQERMRLPSEEKWTMDNFQYQESTW